MADPDTGVWLPALRSGYDEPEAALRALAGMYVHGASVDWASVCVGGHTDQVFDGSRRVILPTYPFQRQRFWPRVLPGRGDVASAGQHVVGHPLLAAAVWLAEGDGLVLTGRLSRVGQPWLADHAVFDEVLLPGTAFVELAVYAGDQVDCGVIEELTLEEPLLLPEREGVQLQVCVGDSGSDGRRPVTVSSRVEGEQGGWTVMPVGC